MFSTSSAIDLNVHSVNFPAILMFFCSQSSLSRLSPQVQSASKPHQLHPPSMVYLHAVTNIAIKLLNIIAFVLFFLWSFDSESGGHVLKKGDFERFLSGSRTWLTNMLCGDGMIDPNPRSSQTDRGRHTETVWQESLNWNESVCYYGASAFIDISSG